MRSVLLAIVILVGLLLSGGCTYRPRVEGGEAVDANQPAKAAAAGTAADRAAADHLKPRIPGWGFETLGLRVEDDYHVDRFEFRYYCDVQQRFAVERGEVYLPDHVEPPYPLIAVSPILGGALTDYLECRIFGWVMAKAGYASFFLYQDEWLLKPYDGAIDLERALRAWVRNMGRSLDLILANYPIDRHQLATFGISLGGIRNVLVAASDDRYAAHVVCLAGADLAEIFATTNESLVTRYLNRRGQINASSKEQVIEDLRRHLVSDPEVVAPAIPTERILLFLARLDNKVPVETGWDLYEALGRPDLRLSPLGHYTSMLVIPWAIKHSRNFYAHWFSKSR